jgi:hypothetical protein
MSDSRQDGDEQGGRDHEEGRLRDGRSHTHQVSML